MKTIVTSTFALLALNSFGQGSNFDRGYKEGYTEGYCYQVTGCIGPITPLPPIPKTSENSSSYKDGYNRGFLDGRSKRDDENRRKEGGQAARTSNQYVATDYQPAYDNSFLKLYMQQLEIRRQQQAAQLARMKEEERRELEKAERMTAQTLNIYSSYRNKPSKIGDGWYNVVSLDRVDFCENRLVRVQNNSVVEYFVEAVKFDNNKSSRKVLAGGKIEEGKTIMKIIPFNEPNEQEASYVEIYFIDNLMNPNARAEAPVQSGRVSFWTDVKNGGEKKILMYQSVDKDAYAGSITTYFSNEAPFCGQGGTQTFECSPGVYQYTAWDGKRKWNGTVTISSGGCKTFKLTK